MLFPLQRCDAPCARVDQLARVHDAQHIQYIWIMFQPGTLCIDGDTVMSPMSGQAVLRATGGVCHAVDKFMAEGLTTPLSLCGLLVIMTSHTMWILLLIISVGAMHARDKHGCNASVLLIGMSIVMAHKIFFGTILTSFMPQPTKHRSTRAQDPLTKREHGTIMNFPLAPGTQGTTVLNILNNDILPALRAFQPNLIMISAVLMLTRTTF